MLFEQVQILDESYNDDGEWLVNIETTARQFEKLLKQPGFSDLVV